MASEQEGQEQVELSPEDILGASISAEQIEKLTVSQLKFWLKCRRIIKVAIKRNFWEGMLSYMAFCDCLSICKLNKQPVLAILWLIKRNFAHDHFRVKNLNSLRPWTGVTRLKQEHTDLLNVSVDIETVATNHINKFPRADSAFTNDFSLLPKFGLMTDTLQQQQLYLHLHYMKFRLK